MMAATAPHIMATSNHIQRQEAMRYSVQPEDLPLLAFFLLFRKNPSQKFYLPAEFLVCLISQIWVTWPRIAIRESGKEASICLPRWEADKKDKHWLGVALAKRVCHNTLPALDQLGQQEQTQIEIVLIFQHWACG